MNRIRRPCHGEVVTDHVGSGQGRHIMRAFAGTLNGAMLDREQGRRITLRAGELKAHVLEGMYRLAASEQYSYLETPSTTEYPGEYTGPLPLEQQVTLLRGRWPKLEPGKRMAVLERKRLAPSAEGWCAYPLFSAIAPSYGEALEKEVFAAITRDRTLKNWCEGRLGEHYLRQLPRTIAFEQRVVRYLGGTILAVQTQMGRLHRGRAVIRARELMIGPQFGLGALAVGSFTLLHPSRFIRWEQLHADCPGDEYSPDGGGEFQSAPFFHWGDARLDFGTDFVDRPYSYFGSASAFLPQ